MNKKVWKIGCLYILVSSFTMTGEVKAACTPTPDGIVGMIYYSDKSCSDEVDDSKTAIGVVKDNALIVALNIPDMRWASAYTNVSGITETTDKKYLITYIQIMQK